MTDVEGWCWEPVVTAIEGSGVAFALGNALRQALANYEADHGAPRAVVLAIVGVEGTPPMVRQLGIAVPGDVVVDRTADLVGAVQMHGQAMKAKAFAAWAFAPADDGAEGE